MQWKRNYGNLIVSLKLYKVYKKLSLINFILDFFNFMMYNRIRKIKKE